MSVRRLRSPLRGMCLARAHFWVGDEHLVTPLLVSRAARYPCRFYEGFRLLACNLSDHPIPNDETRKILQSRASLAKPCLCFLRMPGLPMSTRQKIAGRRLDHSLPAGQWVRNPLYAGAEASDGGLIFSSPVVCHTLCQQSIRHKLRTKFARSVCRAFGELNRASSYVLVKLMPMLGE